MPEIIISGIPVNFPFEPYDVQKAYMSKVIDSLNSGTNAVLESPTGTGKTLSLLCSSLAWVLYKKAQFQAEVSNARNTEQINIGINELNEIAGNGKQMKTRNWGVPKIIYASRTHSQLTQAMQELKQTSYSFMKAVVLGSRDQLCIHPEVSKEFSNSGKLQMCKIRVTTHTCSFYFGVEKNKDNPEISRQPVMDIEDLIKVGQKLRMCPYYSAKELATDADITFMPYNYLLDPKARKANKVELNNTVVILDEAHNVENICEDSASIELKSSDIAVAIDDITHVMKAFNDSHTDMGDEAKDFTVEDLALLKEMLLEFEKAVDAIEVKFQSEGTTYPASFMFELLAKANVHAGNHAVINRLLDSLIQFLAVAASQENSAFRKGGGLQIMSDLITIVFSGKEEDREKVLRCFKVHVEIEEQKQNKHANKDGWITPKTTKKTTAKIIHYWCFNPGFGMEQLLNKNVHSIILTSGTLAPLKPLIAELGIPISSRLENPHIVGKSQVCVKIVPYGPDKEQLNSNFKNRDNPKYICSLGRTILSVCPIIPDGLLIFFPSYTILNKCMDSWQASGIWTQIARHKPIFVEPRTKEAFTNTMTEFYANINDPDKKGACFMAVCRGKVSEGLDFADMNGRAVIITGLPFPPLKDPRVTLKRKYLDDNRTKENELLSGNDWYGLEAIRAVNQAIGRVIRHKNDYGAILLCDARFNNSLQKSQLSSWIQGHLQQQQHTNFGQLIREIANFFRHAEKTLPKPSLREMNPLIENTVTSQNKFSNPNIGMERKNKYLNDHQTAIKIEKTNAIQSWNPSDYSYASGSKTRSDPTPKDFMSRLDSNVSVIDFNNCSLEEGNQQNLVTIHKRERGSPPSAATPSTSSSCAENLAKKKRLKLVSNPFTSSTNSSDMSNYTEVPVDRTELLKLIKGSISSEMYSKFVKALMAYQKNDQFNDLFSVLIDAFGHRTLHYLLRGMKRFVKEVHKSNFDESLEEYLR